MAEFSEPAFYAPSSVIYPSPAVSLRYDGFCSIMEPMPMLEHIPFPGAVESYDPSREYFANPYRLGDEIFRELEAKFATANS